MHVVSQRAWGLRLRGTAIELAFSSVRVWPSPSVHRVGVPVAFSKLNTQPADTSVYASAHTSRWEPQDSRPGGSLLLSCRTLSFPTTCRFIPALGQPACFLFLKHPKTVSLDSHLRQKWSRRIFHETAAPADYTRFMPRRARVVVPNVAHQIIEPGNNPSKYSTPLRIVSTSLCCPVTLADAARKLPASA